MWSQEEVGAEAMRIGKLTAQGDTTGLMGSIALSLLRIANAQEAIHELAVQDLNEAVEQHIAQRAEERANEMMEEKTGRGFIGKKK